MTIYWSDEACRRSGLSDDDLLHLSGDDSSDTDAVVKAWRDNLTPEPDTDQEIEEITERHPSLFRAKPSS